MYTNQLEKIHWFRVDERKPHKHGGAAHAGAGPHAAGRVGPADEGLRLRRQHGQLWAWPDRTRGADLRTALKCSLGILLTGKFW